MTTPDAIAFGSLCAALLAAYAGLVKGDRARHEAKRESGMHPIGSGIVDHVTLRDLVLVLQDLVAALRDGIAAGHPRGDQDRGDLADRIRDLVARIDEGKPRSR